MASSKRHSICPHPDLPTITEALESEENYDDDEENNDVGNAAVEDNEEPNCYSPGSDSGSKVSYANSYAFTLDGVGFDEENSLLSGICSGSVIYHMTPPPAEDDHGGASREDAGARLAAHERELHREACRKLGIPWSNTSNSDHGSDHDGGANPKQKKSRKNGLWPWPDVGKVSAISTQPPTLDSLDDNMKSYALSTSFGSKAGKKRRRNMNKSALCMTIALISICLIGILVTAFTSNDEHSSNPNSNGVEAEVIVMEGHPQPKISATLSDLDVSTADASSSSTGESNSHKTKASKETDLVSSTRVIDNEKEADCITSMCTMKLSSSCILKYKINKAPIASLTMELICDGESWVGIGFSTNGQMVGSEAILGVPSTDESGNNISMTPQKYALDGKDNSSVIPMDAEKQTLIDASVKVTRKGRTVLKFTKIMKEENEVEIRPGVENTFLFAQGMGLDVGYHAVGESFKITLPEFEEEVNHEQDDEVVAADNTSVVPAEKEDTDTSVIESSSVEEQGLDPSCVDQTGKFTTRNNKNRACHWLGRSESLHSAIQDRECGIQALGIQPSKLGMNCRYTCRAYNGCLKQGAANDVEVEKVQPPPQSIVDELIADASKETEEKVEEAPALPCTVDVCNLELSHTCLLKYKVDVPTVVTPVNAITMELICEGESWVGVGFSNDGQMIGSEAVLGVPGGDIPQKYVLGGKDNSSVKPMAAHRQTLMDTSVTFENGLTILKFTKIMKEEGEVEIKSGVENTFLYAQGMGLDVGYHAVGESFPLNLPDNVEKVEDADTEDTFIDVTKGLERPCSWLDIRNHGKFWPGICISLCIQLSLTTFSELNDLQNKDKCAEIPTVLTNSFKLLALYLAQIISA